MNTKRDDFDSYIKNKVIIPEDQLKRESFAADLVYGKGNAVSLFDLWNAAIDSKSEWISVEDRLPKDDALVVAAHVYNYGTLPDAAVCYCLHGSFHVHTDGIEASNYDGGACIRLDMDITHWMPLPEPPKEVL